eukprot:scaffold2393_cov267-Pinguiococcus_pyrenoidosus.AAC.7
MRLLAAALLLRTGQSLLSPARALSSWQGSWEARRQSGALKAALPDGDRDDDDDADAPQVFSVAEHEAGLRLDVVLSQHFEEQGRSRNYYAQLLKEGFVTCNGKVAKKSLKPDAGDEVSVRFRWTEELRLEAEHLPGIAEGVLFEDDDVLVLNKPSGLVVHPAPGNWNGTLVNGVLHYLRRSGSAHDWDSQETERPGVVHRLDKGTTGVMVLAKNSLAHAALSQAFAQRLVEKEYVCICYGRPSNAEIEVETLIGRHPQHRQRMVALPLDSGDRTGKLARSTVHIVGWDEKISLLRVEIYTGRTHQIRVHLQHLKCPILGDEVYGSKDINLKLEKDLGITRPLLHAHRLAFPHPTIEGKTIEVKAPLPTDFYEVAGHILAGLPDTF